MESLRAQYARGQSLMRQWNHELVEFERMRAYYKSQGQEPPYKTLGAFRRETRKPREEQSSAMQAWKRHTADDQQYERWKGILGAERMPKTLDKFEKLKYNKKYKQRFAQLKRERDIIKAINQKQWTDTFKEKARNTYYSLRESGIEISDHGVARFLQRGYTEEQLIEIHKKPFNYSQTDGKKVKFYNQIAVVYNSEETEVVSILDRLKKRGDWIEI